jgi:hypothetical protein
MKGHLRRSGLRNLGRLTVSAALVAWRHFFAAPLASRTGTVRSGPVLAPPCIWPSLNRLQLRLPRYTSRSTHTMPGCRTHGGVRGCDGSSPLGGHGVWNRNAGIPQCFGYSS